MCWNSQRRVPTYGGSAELSIAPIDPKHEPAVSALSLHSTKWQLVRPDAIAFYRKTQIRSKFGQMTTSAAAFEEARVCLLVLWLLGSQFRLSWAWGATIASRRSFRIGVGNLRNALARRGAYPSHCCLPPPSPHWYKKIHYLTYFSYISSNISPAEGAEGSIQKSSNSPKWYTINKLRAYIATWSLIPDQRIVFFLNICV